MARLGRGAAVAWLAAAVAAAFAPREPHDVFSARVIGGTHVVAQLVFDSVPDPATHVLVVGSVHV